MKSGNFISVLTYEYSPDLVLRFPKEEISYDRFEYEFKVYQSIGEQLQIPKVHQIVYFGSAPCILMQKIDGVTLIRNAYKSLPRLLSLPRRFANLHVKTLRIKAGPILTSNIEKAKYCISKSNMLNFDEQSTLISKLESLNNDGELCHGDFHPENIIVTRSGEYIIDWSAASSGHPAFDIANTFLLLINLPILPGWSERKYRLQRFGARILGFAYLRIIRKKMGISLEQFWPYFLIKVAERTFYGLESEKRCLRLFLDRWFESENADFGKLVRKIFA